MFPVSSPALLSLDFFHMGEVLNLKFAGTPAPLPSTGQKYFGVYLINGLGVFASGVYLKFAVRPTLPSTERRKYEGILVRKNYDEICRKYEEI